MRNLLVGIFLLFLLVMAGCKRDEALKPSKNVPAWSVYQSAAPAFRIQYPSTWQIIASSSGTLVTFFYKAEKRKVAMFWIRHPDEAAYKVGSSPVANAILLGVGARPIKTLVQGNEMVSYEGVFSKLPSGTAYVSAKGEYYSFHYVASKEIWDDTRTVFEKILKSFEPEEMKSEAVFRLEAGSATIPAR